MEYKKLILAKENGIATVTLNRPEVLNALDTELSGEMERVVKDLEDDKEVRVVVLTGAGKAFCAGRDMQGMASQARGEYRPQSTGKPTRSGPWGIGASLWNMPKPVIAAVNGVAAGGGLSIMLACDIIIASEQARFVEVYIKRGLIASGGATYLLPHLVGPARAKEMLFTGDIIDAREAERIGLVNRVYPVDEFEDAVKSLAEKLAKNSPKALGMMKKLVNEGLTSNLQSAGQAENQAQFILFESEDFREGVQAFIEKREARFKGE